MPTYRLTVEYEGTKYRGWQEQKNARTVAGELRRAIEEVVGEKVELGGSGRTDAGVHALAQVAHLKTKKKIRAADLLRAIEEPLPADIHLLAAEPAADRFHSRHEAVSRSYLYQISRRRTALAKRFVWWVRRPLDLDRMRRAAEGVVGRHDFFAFCEKPEEQTSTLVVVERAEIAAAGDLVLVRIQASHFLWKMVRRLVGALVAVGAGELGVEEFAALLAAKKSRGPVTPAPVFETARATAPPSGLFLERVVYPGEPPLGPLAPVTPVVSR
jgi:tRNA pseudouridine38-40 synthase